MLLDLGSGKVYLAPVKTVLEGKNAEVLFDLDFEKA